MKEISNELDYLIIETYEKYKDLDEKTASIRLSDDKWSLKEIIGHLIDSASNNHQRFVRLQIEKELIFPAYHYSWIEIEKYNSMKFHDIILLWKQFNILLSHLIENVNNEALNNYWRRDDKIISLKDLFIEYLKHLKEHIKHFEDRLNEIQEKK